MQQRLLLSTSLAAALLATGIAHANDGASRFQMMDTNKDGRISAAEHAAASQKMFTMLDTDRDGSVTMAEMSAHMDMMKGQQRGMEDMTSHDDMMKGQQRATDGTQQHDMKDRSE